MWVHVKLKKNMRKMKNKEVADKVVDTTDLLGLTVMHIRTE